MTDRIDLDDLETAEESDDEETPNRGDWLWQDDGDPDDEPAPPSREPASTASRETDAETAAQELDAEPTAPETDSETAVPSTPRVPRTDDDRPVGIPKTGGGSGGAPAGGTDAGPSESDETDPDPETAQTADGPHGGGADDMAMAFTYNAIRRLENLHTALSDTETWTDWLGVVGDVDAHVINKFQRDNRIDLDFFNGTGTGPAERLTDIDEHSMFYAERMVVVGDPDEEWIAAESGWEFVPLETAAEEAGWELTSRDD